MFPKRRRRILVTRGGNRLPQSGLIFYSRLPNSEDVLWDEDALWDENMLWGGWVLPVELYSAVGVDFWFSDATTPVARTGAEILAWPSINTTINGIEVTFSLTEGLSVKWHRIAYIPNAYPFVDRDGGDGITRVSGTGLVLTATDTYTLPVSWIAALGAMGVDHWAYNAGGTPKTVLGALIKENGIGPRWYAGDKGMALYAVDQTVKDASIKKYLKWNAVQKSLIERLAAGRVDFVGIGDSNQILSGYGWDHGFQKALYTKYPMYATEIMSIFENAGAGVGMGYLYANSTTSAFSTSGFPSECLAWNAPHLSYRTPGYLPGPGITNVGPGIGTSSGCLLGVTDELQFDAYYCAMGEGSAGKFKLFSRQEVSATNNIVTGPWVSCDGPLGELRKASLTIPAGARNGVSGRVGVVGDGVNSLVPPIYISNIRLQNPGRQVGVCYHTLVYAGGKTLWDMAAYLRSATDDSLTHFFDIIRQDQGSEKTVVICINSGLNDRGETEPSIVNGYTPGESPDAFIDNLSDIISRVKYIWTKNAWSQDELFWLLSVSHPVSEPDDIELVNFRTALSNYAETIPKSQVIDMAQVTNYTEMLASGWYASGGTDVNHLTTIGYETLAGRIVDLIDM